MTMTPSYRLRSYVRRDSRRTPGQERAYTEGWPELGLEIKNGLLNIETAFGRQAPTFLEIGFGTGQSLLELAKQQPDKNFIGVETHKPGIGSLFQGIEKYALTNIRVFHADVIDVLQQCIAESSLDGAQIFFPDPWPKRRHNARRLIQSPFIQLLTSKLKPAGIIHLATDWQDYAFHMLQVLTIEKVIVNVAKEEFAERSPLRPIVTKFERRALREGRKIWDLHFKKLAPAESCINGD